MASATLAPVTGWLVGETISVYERDSRNVAVGSAVTTAVVGADSTTAFTGLTAETKYIAKDAQGHEVRFGTHTDPESAQSGSNVFIQEDRPDEGADAWVWYEIDDHGTPTGVVEVYAPDPTLVPAAPVNTAAPAISPSTCDAGDTLTCSTGTWTGVPTPTYGYQWKRDGSNIVGETGATYDTVDPTDVDADITCSVTATNTQGVVSAASSNTVTPAAPAASTYWTAVLALTPAALLKLGEPSGSTANDETANNNDGTYTGMTLAQTGIITGESDTSVSSRGGIQTDHVNIPSDASLPDCTGDFTVLFWVDPAPLSGTQALIDAAVQGGGGGGRACHLSINSSGQLNWLEIGGGGDSDTLTTPFDASVQMVTIVRRGANCEIWRNATKVYDKAQGGTSALGVDLIGSDGFYLGSNPTGGGGNYNGKYQGFAAWDSALTSGQIGALYTDGTS